MAEVVTDIESFSELREPWDALAKGCTNPLMQFDWFSSLVECIGNEYKLHIFLTRSNGIIDAIAPMCRRNVNGIPTLEFIGATSLYEPSGLLYASNDALSRLLNDIQEYGLPVIFSRIPSDCALMENIAGWKKRFTYIHTLGTKPSCYLDIGGKWDEFFSQLSSSRKYFFRRKIRKLNNRGNVGVKIFCPTPDSLDKYLDITFDVEDKSWKGRTGSSIKKNDFLNKFFRKYSRRSAEKDKLRICLYYLDDFPIAMHIAIIDKQTFWVLKLGYNEKYSDCSPGMLLANETIKYCYDNKIMRYEFLGSDEKWQHSWPVKHHSYSTMIIFPFSVRGLLGLFLSSSILFLKAPCKLFNFR